METLNNNKMEYKHTEEERIKATRGLFRLMYINFCKSYETKAHDVKYFLDKGAYVTGIETRWGLPIHMALYFNCDPDVIQILKDYGGIDKNYKKIYGEWFYVKGAAQIDEHIYRYYTILNILIIKYHWHTKSNTVTNRIIDLLNKQKYIKTKFRVKDKKYKRINIVRFFKFSKICKILDVDIKELKNMEEELPIDLQTNDSEYEYFDEMYDWRNYKYLREIDGDKKQWCPFRKTEYKYKSEFEFESEYYEKNPNFIY
jgi:hypothetical protein